VDDIIQLATLVYMYNFPFSLQAQLATGMMLLGAVVPDSARRLGKVAPSAAFDSVLKVRHLESIFDAQLCPLCACPLPGNWSLQGSTACCAQGSHHQLNMVASKQHFGMCELEHAVSGF
jgi:hypothetical protein